MIVNTEFFFLFSKQESDDEEEEEAVSTPASSEEESDWRHTFPPRVYTHTPRTKRLYSLCWYHTDGQINRLELYLLLRGSFYEYKHIFVTDSSTM